MQEHAGEALASSEGVVFGEVQRNAPDMAAEDHPA
jgi:hypothetical protein